ncbi:MAG: PKD domain-containing protein [Parashewanella sp.]
MKQTKRFQWNILCALCCAFSFAAYSTPSHQQNLHQVQETTLISGKDYELKSINYSQNGVQYSSTLYFIHSKEGVVNAINEAGLSVDEKTGLLADFAEGESQVVVLDKELSEQKFIDSPSLNDYLFRRGLLEVQRQEIASLKAAGNQPLADENGVLMCKQRNKGDKGFGKKLDFPFYRSKTAGSAGANANYVIDAEFKADADARIYYEYDSRYCVPYKFLFKKLVAKADYQARGNIDFSGHISDNFDVFDWKSTRKEVAKGWFPVGPIPVKYDIELPIKAGIGQINFQAKGEVGLFKQLDIEGHFVFECTLSGCKQTGSNFIDKGAFKPSNVKYPNLATFNLEPYLNVTLENDIYNKLLWANVGTKETLPISVMGYFGNTCDNGDGIGGNETVNAGLLNVDITGKAFAEGNTFQAQNWPLLNENVYFMDLVQPSTALSPIVRPNISGKQVSLSVGVRSCVSMLPSRYQNYSVDWGDGSTDKISHMKGFKMLTHSYGNKGNYHIVVNHVSGPSTQLNINL